MMPEVSAQEIAEWEAKIPQMTHEEMAALLRFAPTGHSLFRVDLPLWELFKTRFREFGGMTPEISKRIGTGDMMPTYVTIRPTDKPLSDKMLEELAIWVEINSLCGRPTRRQIGLLIQEVQQARAQKAPSPKGGPERER